MVLNATARCWLVSVLACLLFTPMSMSIAVAETPTAPWQDRVALAEFERAWAAAGRGDLETLRAGVARMQAEHGGHPLLSYLEFEWRRQSIEAFDEDSMSQFLARHRDWSFAPQLELTWLRSMARRQHHAALLRHPPVSPLASNDAAIACGRAAAKLALGQTDGLASEIEALWRVGRSQPRACDSVFAWWRRQGHPSTTVAWQRFDLAMHANEVTLARYLRRYLDPDQRPWADRWLAMRARPAVALTEARSWPVSALSRTIVADGLLRLARRDWAHAQRSWPQLAAHFSDDPPRALQIQREAALFQAVALDAGAIAAIDALPQRDDQLLAWRARVSMAEANWPEVLASIQAMSVSEQAQARWRYWRGRALKEMGRPDAILAWGSLAGEANYYGFLAAARLALPLSLCPQSLQADQALQAQLRRDPELQRALALHQVGLHDHARRTWSRATARMSTAQRHQLALLATEQGWYDRAIVALADGASQQAYQWRFPLKEKDKVVASSARWQVDPALVYGLMRAESAMQPDAHSPAGARGLLQLMPSTAEAVARRNGLPLNGANELWQPDINLELGIAHLAELQARYDGNWVQVAAAYNAGVNAVQRWLDQPRQLPPDVWLETLPFFETRDYVPRVLAFATIYEWQLQRSPQLLAQQLLGTVTAPPSEGAGFVCGSLP